MEFGGAMGEVCGSKGGFNGKCQSKVVNKGQGAAFPHLTYGTDASHALPSPLSPQVLL